MTKAKTRVVIVGGGFGGVKTALQLANKPGFQVQLISNNTHFEYHGALYRSAVGHSPREVVIPLSQIFEGKKNVELILDSIGFIDPKKKCLVSLEGAIYPYDTVVLALGNQVDYFGIKGLKEHTETITTISDTMRLRRRLIDAFTKNPSKPIRVAVVGGGASGVELAAEIDSFAKLVAKKHRIARPKVNVVLVEGADRLLPSLSPEVSEKVLERLIKLGVEVHLNLRVATCKKGSLCVNTGNIDADILIWTAGSKPVSFFTAHPDIFTLGRGSRVMVDEYMRAQNQSDIYVIGDNADTKYSGMAQTALKDAKFVARNLLLTQQGKQKRSYKPRRPLYVITAGGKWAIVQKGTSVYSGIRGWRVRRKADLWIFRNFEPLKKAIKIWKSGEVMSKDI